MVVMWVLISNSYKFCSISILWSNNNNNQLYNKSLGLIAGINSKRRLRIVALELGFSFLFFFIFLLLLRPHKRPLRFWEKTKQKSNGTTNENIFELYNATERSVLLLLIHQILTFIQSLSGVGNSFFVVVGVEFGSLTIETVALCTIRMHAHTHKLTAAIIYVCELPPSLGRSRIRFVDDRFFLFLSVFFFSFHFLSCVKWLHFVLNLKIQRNTW